MRTIKYLRRVYKDMKDTAEMSKAKQEESGGEVTTLKAELAQAQEQLTRKEYVLIVKEADLANEEKELAG